MHCVRKDVDRDSNSHLAIMQTIRCLPDREASQSTVLAAQVSEQLTDCTATDCTGYQALTPVNACTVVTDWQRRSIRHRLHY